MNFSDDEIQEMDTDMLKWWKEYKSLIVNGIEFIKDQMERKK
jgi:hypothetical protein